MWKWLKRWFGLGRRARGLDELAQRLGLPADRLQVFEPRYSQFAIPKRTGGTRIIHAPDAELKTLQRRVLRRVLGPLQAHPAAMAFECGKSFVQNARLHCGRAVVVRLDIREFFPSVSPQQVEPFFRRAGWDAAAAALLTRLCTWQGGLPQGAPTSPRLSNLVNRRLDARLEGLARHFGGRYTRYADDLVFSFERDRPGSVRQLIRGARRICRLEGYRLHRRKKLHVRRRHQRQFVTGLVVNQRVQLPRETRRWLRAVEHRYAQQMHSSRSRLATSIAPTKTPQPTLTPSQMLGWMSLRRMIAQSTNQQ